MNLHSPPEWLRREPDDRLVAAIFLPARVRSPATKILPQFADTDEQSWPLEHHPFVHLDLQSNHRNGR